MTDTPETPTKIMAWPSEAGAITGEWSANQYFSDHAEAYLRRDTVLNADEIDALTVRVAELEEQLRKVTLESAAFAEALVNAYRAGELVEVEEKK